MSRRARRRNALLIVVLAASFASVTIATGTPATVSSLQRVSGPSPIAGICPVSIRSIVNDSPLVDPGSVDREEETEVAVNPLDPKSVAVSWLQDAGRAVVVASTKDGGATWKTVVVPGLTTCTGGELERVVHTRLTFGPDGALYLATHPLDGFAPDPGNLRTHVAVSHSADGGETWADPVFLDHLPVLNDPDPIAAEPDVPGAVDALWSPTEIVLEPIVLARSTDHGRTWTDHTVRKAMPGIVAATRVLAHPDGTLLVFIHDAPARWFLGAPAKLPLSLTRSEDKGLTWSEPQVLTPDASAYNWPLAAVGPDGTVFIAWRSLRSDGYVDVFLRRSTDAGATWSAPQFAFSYLPKGRNDPVMAAGPGGALAVAFYDGRNDAAGGANDIEVWLAHSHDAGATWQETRIGGPFDLSSVPNDYFGLIQGLAGSPCGFLASFVLGGPVAERGQTDIYLARIAVGDEPSTC